MRDIVPDEEKDTISGISTEAVLLRYVQKNSKKMAGTTSQHKEMPDSMAVNNFFIKGVENNSNGIEQSPGNQQDHACTRKSPRERANSNHSDPAHEQVNYHREDAPAFRKQDVLKNSDHGKPPDHSEQRPSPGSAQGNEGKRGIAAGDQQINCAMIEFLEDPLGCSLDTVVKSRRGIQCHKRAAVDAATDDLPGVTGQSCANQQKNEADNRKYDSQ
jgi:hypothetical protein